MFIDAWRLWLLDLFISLLWNWVASVLYCAAGFSVFVLRQPRSATSLGYLLIAGFGLPG